MEPKYEYASELNLYQANYMRNSKAIGVLWAVFTICFAIINVVVFIQPHWLGDTKESRGTGHFGLWQYCHLIQDGQDVTCQGRLDDFSSIPSAAFRAATVFVGLSVVMVLLCICCMLLFFVFHSSTVFHICGWMQVFCGESLPPSVQKRLHQVVSQSWCVFGWNPSTQVLVGIWCSTSPLKQLFHLETTSNFLWRSLV
ncbi:hypothetical protein HPB48_014445 [Haemaphysalis longicornis]|uniref:LHFPL tetraspan subfamily member 3 protein n=1 Tax=Haemaphysalis longicornis TaxID=44386 RepID=A0A9J6H3P4_HAELO|nr:hypothetical protein HPB48_014445 [Haemaphysalis longicornis]